MKIIPSLCEFCYDNLVMIKDRAFYKRLVRIMIPLIVQLVISFCVQMLDTVMVGALGDDAVSGVTLAAQPYFIFNTLIFGFTSGGSIMISQYWGKQDTHHIRKVMAIMIWAVFLISVVYMSVCYLLPDKIIGIFSKDPVLIAEGVSYLRIVIWAYLFSALATSYFSSMTAKENARISAFVYVVSFIVNVIANYAFIFGHFGMPAMGIAGAALGTVIARFTELVLAFLYARYAENDVRFRLSDLKDVDFSLIPMFFKTSILVLMDDLVWSLNTSAQVAVIGHLNSNYVAAASIASVAQNFALIIVYATSRATAITMGKIVGEGDYVYARKAGNTFLFLSLFVGLFASGLILLLRNPILSMYPNITADTRLLSFRIMTVISVILIPSGLENSTIVGVLRGSGDTSFAFWCDALCMWGIGFTMGCLAAFVWKLPILWVYFFLRCDCFVKVIIASARVLRGKYIKDVTVA